MKRLPLSNLFYFPLYKLTSEVSGHTSLNSMFVFFNTGCTKSEAISHKGSKTNLRNCNLGCGNIKSSSSLIISP